MTNKDTVDTKMVTFGTLKFINHVLMRFDDK
jgi:hypothetical protein